MAKKIVRAKRKLTPYKCGVCHRTVEVYHATEKTTETDTKILIGWDYGHRHKVTVQLQKDPDGEERLTEVYVD